jgi:hypothetical protein
MSERLDAAWKALEQDAAEPNISMAEYQRRFARHRSLIEAAARADALAKVEALSPGYIKKGDGFEPAVSLAALRAILAERQP